MFALDPDYVPFCGSPPLPSDLLVRWTFEPALIVGLLFALALGLALVPRTDQRWTTLLSGWGITALAFISPLCALSIALFSARVGQHLLLVLVAAPLFAHAIGRIRISPMIAAAAFSALFWFWHVPAPYQATLESDWTYWAMHLSLLGSAVLWWGSMMSQLALRPFEGFLSSILVGTQMSILSALLVFSNGAWHGWHALPAMAYGLSGLEDQVLAGAVMWVFGAAVLIAAIAALLVRLLNDQESESALPKDTHGFLRNRTTS